MTTTRIAQTPPKYHGANESLAYTFDFTNIGTPSSPSVFLKDILEETDYSATKISGSASVSGDNVTTGLVSGLSYGSQYKLICRATVSGNTVEVYMILICDRL